MNFLPPEESSRRIAAIQDRMRSADPPIDGAILVQNVDVAYFAGTYQSCHLVVPAAGTPRLLVRKLPERARDDSPLDDVRPMTSMRDLAQNVRDLCGQATLRIGLELDVLPARQLEAYRGLLGNDVAIADISEMVLDVRSVKSEWEIEKIREASRLIARVIADLPVFLEENISTWELQSLLECRAKTLGHPGVIRMRGLNVECSMAVVVSGASGAVPSHSFFPIGGTGIDPAWPAGGDLEKIRQGAPIAIDILGCSAGYYADQTRMAVKGRFPEEAARIYGAMQDILRHCEKTIRAGSIPSQAYIEALDVARGRGLERGLGGIPPHSVRFIGHSIGLEVNEVPVIAPNFDRPLAAGTVIAIEPKFAHPAWGVIGIESTYAVREDGLENLTPIPEAVVQV